METSVASVLLRRANFENTFRDFSWCLFCTFLEIQKHAQDAKRKTNEFCLLGDPIIPSYKSSKRSDPFQKCGRELMGGKRKRSANGDRTLQDQVPFLPVVLVPPPGWILFACFSFFGSEELISVSKPPPACHLQHSPWP